MITVKMNNFDLEKMANQIIRDNWIDFQIHMTEKIGPLTAQYMRNYIQEHQKRDKGDNNLSNHMVSVPLYGFGFAKSGFGIGNISELNIEAPYWHLINYGGMHPMAKMGKGVYGEFTDGPARGKTDETARFIQGSSGPIMFPLNPIMPMNYIDATWDFMRNAVYNSLAKLKLKTGVNIMKK